MKIHIIPCLILLSVISGSAAPGDLDPTFGIGGKLIDGVLVHSRDDANGVAIQADAKIVVAGSGDRFGGSVARYNPDGSLDATFGSNGRIAACNARAIAIQADGKIVVGCTEVRDSTSNFGIVRFNPDGSPDISFGIDGKVTTSMGGGYDELKSIAIQSDGKIVAAGSSDSMNGIKWYIDLFAVARYNADGSLDTTFHGDGKVITLVGPYHSSYPGNGVAVQSDGRIIVVGSVFLGPANGHQIGGMGRVLIRYNVNGSLDTSFSSDGVATTQCEVVECGDYTSSVAIQADGKIVTAGRRGGFNVARYNIDGSPDSTFGGGGSVVTPIGPTPNNWANSVAIQSDGKIVAAGLSYFSTTGLTDTDLAVARYNSNGSLDTTFDGDGIVTTPVNQGVSQINAVALQPDGKIVGVGYTSPWFLGGSSSESDNFIVARYNDNGSPDTTFDSDGIVITDFSYPSGSLSDVVVQPDGKIVAVGGGPYYFGPSGMARYNPDGSRDTTFAGGTGMANVGGSAIALQTDGKILTAGYDSCGDVNETYGFLARVDQDGSLDTSFGGDGTVEFGSCDGSWFSSLAIQPDGKIVSAGSVVARYNSDGSLDTTFGGGDGVSDPINAQAMALQADGKIVLARFHYGPPSDFSVARLNSDGSFDTTFDGDGIAITSVAPGDDYANSVVIQPDGKIVAAGRSSNGSNKDVAVVRYNTNGTLDTTFSSDGIATTPASPDYDQATSIGILNDGKLVFAGSSNADFTVYRYTTNGTLDNTFSDDGIASVDFHNLSDDHLYAMAFDGKGRAVLGGASNGAMALARIRLQSNAPFDYDDDGRTDISVYRPSGGSWYVLNSGANSPPYSVTNWGNPSDIPTPADFDNDGKTDVAVYRPSSGEWFIMNSFDSSFTVTNWGTAGDRPLAKDFDGDGRADISVYRPSNGTWYIFRSDGTGWDIVQWGAADDIPVPGNFDSDNKADIAVYRSSTGQWFVLPSMGGGYAVSWGTPGDKPVAADYDGDGKDDIAVYRPSEGNWYILKSGTNNSQADLISWGVATDIPVPGDYDGDGRADVAQFRPSTGDWFVLRSTSGYDVVNWGIGTDKPIPASYSP